MSDKCKALHSELVSNLTDIRDDSTRPTQSLIDYVYENVLTLMGPTISSHPKHKKRTKGPPDKGVIKGGRRDTYMLERNISSRKTETSLPDIYEKGYHG